MHCPLDERFEDQEIFATDDGSQATTVGSGWIDNGTIGIAQAANQQWIVVKLDATLNASSLDTGGLLEVLSSTGNLMSSRPLEFGFNDLNIPVPIYYSGSKTYIGLGSTLVVAAPNGDLERVEFVESIRSIRGSVRGTMSRIAVAFDNGVQVLWSDEEIDNRRMVCSDMFEPETLFTRTGHLVVAADRRCEVYKTANRQMQFAAVINIDSCVRLMRTKESNQFAVTDRIREDLRLPDSDELIVAFRCFKNSQL